MNFKITSELKGDVSMDQIEKVSKQWRRSKGLLALLKVISKKTKAGEAAHVAERSRTTNQQTGGKNQDLLQHAKEAGGEIVNKVQEQAGSQINRQKETAATEISQVANAVRSIRETLPAKTSGAIARFAADYGDKAAEQPRTIEQLHS